MDSGTACFVIAGLMIVLVLVARSQDRQRLLRQLQQAQLEYQEALSQLKSEPTNPDVKQRTLELGRRYSQLTREGKGITIFDEVALLNDINAATAGATASSQPGQTGTGKVSVEERLAKLSELRSKGMIDEQEYVAKRKQILDEM